MKNKPSLPPEGFRPLQPGEIPTETQYLIYPEDSPGQIWIGPRESIGMPPAGKPAGMGDLYPPKPGPIQKAAQYAADVVVPAAIPTTLSALGGAVGSRVYPGPGTNVGASVGGMVGEGINQALGITEPSVMQVGLSGAAPFAPAALRGILANTPGAEAGLQQLATKMARDIPGRLASKMPYSDLYEAAKQAGAAIPKGPVARASAETSMREGLVAPAIRLTKVSRAIKGVDQILGLPGEDISLETLLPNLQRLGDLYRHAARQGGPSKAALATLYGGIQDALDDAAARGTGAGVQLLREANTAFKRHLAQGEMESLIQQSIKYVGAHESFNADHVLTKLDVGSDVYKQLVKWVPTEEIADIKKTLKVLAKVPSVSVAGKGGLGGLQFAQRAVVSGAIGAAVGGVPGAAGGVVAAEALTRVMMSPGGRAAVKLIASSRLGGQGATFDQIINAALQFSRARMAPEGPTRLGRTAREARDPSEEAVFLEDVKVR